MVCTTLLYIVILFHYGVYYSVATYWIAEHCLVCHVCVLPVHIYVYVVCMCVVLQCVCL